MVIRLVTHRHAFLLQFSAALLVNLHFGVDRRLGGIFSENMTYLVEHPNDSGTNCYTRDVILMVNEILSVGVALRRCLCKIA